MTRAGKADADAAAASAALEYTNNDRGVHYPSPKFATPIDVEPDYTNNATKATLLKCGEFIYDCPAFEDNEAITLH